MNRNISVLILLALVVGAILIGYNKWIMRDTYPISQNSSSQSAAGDGTLESQALQKVVMEKPAADTPSSAQSPAPAVAVKVQPVVSSQEPVQPASEKVLTLVKKTVTVAELVDKKPVSSASVTKDVQSSDSGTSSTPQVAKKSALSPLSSVSYKNKELTVRAGNAFTYKIFGLKEPDRFVVDIVGRFSDELPQPKVAEDALVKTVRLGHHDDRVRIVLDLKGSLPANWSATQKNETLSVVLK